MDVESLSTPFGLSGLLEINGFMKDIIDLDPDSDLWRHSKQGFFKINFDAAFDNSKNRLCSGIIVMNFKGDVLASKTMVHDNIPSKFAVEAIACLQAVTMGRDLGMKYVEIEGGSLIVIKKVKNPNKDKSAIGSYIHDIKEQNVTFYECKFQHARRAANKSAHNLASERLKMGKNA
uniref:RNase H type-1 domain-containing protein n=1 Tax=Gossypium raimondii TaxID=29730 RepID=A0A0D2P6F8_GOSRA|nr:hypothetical protein B456_004G040000 [Gossypium raimondii]